MPIEPISNFIAGIKAASGYTPLKNVAASEIINYDIDDFGRLVKRRGYERMNSVALPATPKSLVRAYYRTTGLTSREHLIVACNNATGVWYWNGSAFVELKSSSHSPAASWDSIIVKLLSRIDPEYNPMAEGVRTVAVRLP